MTVIYKITSPSNKINIGQTRHWNNRLNSYKNGWCKGQTKIYNSIRKYGFENHIIDILILFPENIDQISLNFYETYWWRYYKDLVYEMMNIKEPGSNRKHSEETKKLNNKPRTEEHRRHLSEALKGRVSNPLTHSRKGCPKKVIDISTGIIFDSVKEAARCYGITCYSLGYRLRGKVKNTTNLRLL
jgi:group I intron endonuclease